MTSITYRIYVTLAVFLAVTAVRAEDITIHIHADQIVGQVSHHLTGACIEDVNHEIYGGIYSQMVFGESFQEPPLPPQIKGFKAHGGTWELRDGAMHINGADGPKLVSDHAAFKDGAVGVEIFLADKKGDNAGLIVRVDKPGTGADAFIGYEVALDAGRQVLMLGRHRNNFELIEEVPCDVPVGRWIPLEVRLNGSVIEIFVDGKSVLRRDDGLNALAAGTVGLRPWRREAGYRNLWVKTGEKAETLPFELLGEPRAISRMWRGVERGSAKGEYSIVTEKPFIGTQSQRMTFDSGEGELGVENQGLNRTGMGLRAGKDYEGYIWAKAEKPTTLFVSLESRDGSKGYAQVPLSLAAGDWQRFDFTLRPNSDDKAARLAITLKQPGAVTVGHVFLQPGEWGRFHGLPVRRDVVQGLIDEGISVLRYGGSMVNHEGYRWKKMIGPRDRRPPGPGLWYGYSSNGWGIIDFMDLCEEAGFEYIPTFYMDKSPRDMADFIEYAKGPPDSEWGRRRAADGHPKPYRLRYIELGNEERVDETYAAKFEALAAAIWAKDPEITLVVGDFAYNKPIADPRHFSGADSHITSLAGHQRILRFAKQKDREVWFDVHIDTSGPGPSGSLKTLPTYIDALGKVADGARHKVVVFELNSGNHAIRRAIGNALAISVIDRDGRVPIVTSANGLQPAGQNDNGWDQGLLFLNSSQVWLQPPGYVTQMMAKSYQPQRVRCEVTGGDGKLDVNAHRSEDGKTLVLHIVNSGGQAVVAAIKVTGFVPVKPEAQVTELAGPLEGVNTAARTEAVVPNAGEWKHELGTGNASRTFPAYSFTVVRLE